MYRVTKSLNHNALLALKENSSREYLILGKGIGFGKKVNERIEPDESCSIYSLQSAEEKGTGRKQLSGIAPQYLEVANAILHEAEKEFGKVDKSILFPMADHIAFAMKRMRSGQGISNPLTQDIQVLFYKEYRIAQLSKELLKATDGIEIDDHEIGYIALHVHSAICDEKVSGAMQIATAVRECITLIEKEIGKTIDVQTLSYNRLMNHIKYMAARILNKEALKVNMNRYMEHQFPRSFGIAATVCDHLSEYFHEQLPEIEIGYLAMHIERVLAEEAE
ncbi:MAG: PRD domain-containing protein [Roseburia sp.]|nr:PRD domain-containing protein [Roseburia sp.]